MTIRPRIDVSHDLLRDRILGLLDTSGPLCKASIAHRLVSFPMREIHAMFQELEADGLVTLDKDDGRSSEFEMWRLTHRISSATRIRNFFSGLFGRFTAEGVGR